MKTSVAHFLPRREKVYRLGLIGLSGAGKSCILAALGMLRLPNPKGYTATKVPRLPGIEPPHKGVGYAIASDLGDEENAELAIAAASAP